MARSGATEPAVFEAWRSCARRCLWAAVSAGHLRPRLCMADLETLQPAKAQGRLKRENQKRTPGTWFIAI